MKIRQWVQGNKQSPCQKCGKRVASHSPWGAYGYWIELPVEFGAPDYEPAKNRVIGVGCESPADRVIN